MVASLSSLSFAAWWPVLRSQRTVVTPPSDVDIETVASELLAAAVAATPNWVRASVARVAGAQGLEVEYEAVERAATDAAAFVERRLGALLATDIDAQRSTPLTVLRDAARFPVAVLHGAGARPVSRPDTVRWAFPNDPFDVTPATFKDLGEEVHQAGIVWGAAKASIHLQRRRAEGLR
jgi:hypothetical protein